MKQVIEQIVGHIVGYDERTQELIIKAHYDDLETLLKRKYRKVYITLEDSRPLSSKQRRSCFAMVGEIANWSGHEKDEVHKYMKLDFWVNTLWQTADSLFSLSNAPMSVVAAFQSWLARFIISHDVPTKRPMLDYVDDIPNYVYACLEKEKCCICGRKADLHHVERVGMGRNREEIIHEGMEVLPLCREHHEQAHTMPDEDFFNLYHINGGIELDKNLCKIYGLKTKKENK